MSADSGKSALNYSEAEETPSSEGSKFPANWKEAIPCLISSRISIIQAEAKEAAGSAIGKVVLLTIAAACVVLAWLLIVAGIIGVIVVTSSWQWYQAAFAVAGGHLLVAAIAFLLSRSKSADSFPLTRAEFEKDREWLNQLKKQ